MNRRKPRALVLTLLILSVILVAAIVWLWALLNPIEQTDIIGKYISNYEQRNYRNSEKTLPWASYQGGVHRLELREDGTYLYEFTSFDGNDVATNAGTWVFEPHGRQPYVHMAGFAFGPAKYQQEKMDTSRPVSWIYSGIKITINDDCGYYFRKETAKDRQKSGE
jgi:hypothetical protein